MPSFVAVEEVWGDLNRDSCTPTAVDVVTSSLSGEDLVRSYVYQLHADAEHAAIARGAAPRSEEKNLNAALKRTQVSRSSLVGWKQSAEVALEAFAQGRLLVFVDDRQVMPGTPAVLVPARATVRFVQLLPLVGG